MEYMENQNPLVSVIMPCYNHEEYVAQAIESVLNQTYQNIEFIIGDNGSTDGSYEVIRQYEGRVKKIIRLEKNNLKKCGELLLSEAGGDYITTMTSDDYWEPDKIELQMQIFREHPNVKACGTWAVYTDENLIPLQDQSNNVFIKENRSRAQWMRWFIEHGNCIAFPSVVMEMQLRKSLFLEGSRGYKQLGDFYLWLLVIQKADIYIIQKPLMKFRQHFTGGNRNESAPTEENNIRCRNEVADIISEVFEHISDDLFLEAFRNELVNPNTSTQEEILCEKFFLLKRLAEKQYYYQPCVFRFYYNNFNKVDENGKNIGLGDALDRIYHYSRKDFNEWSGQTGIAKYYCDMKKLETCHDRQTKYLQMLQESVLEGKEGKEYEQSLAKIKKMRLCSLPDIKQQMIFFTYQFCGKVLALQEQQDAVGYTAVVDVLNGFISNIDQIWDDLEYIEWGIAEEDRTLFKELVRHGKTKQIDLSESVFPFVNLMFESLQVYFI